MDSQWKDWLRQEKAASRGGVQWPEAIVRGLPFTMVLPIPMDVSADAFAASVALSPGGAVIEDFAVDVGAYEDDATIVTLSLTGAQTLFAGASDGDLDGLTELVFVMRYTPAGGEASRAMGLSIPISDEPVEPV